MVKCTHSQHADQKEVEVTQDGKQVKWTIWPSTFHEGPGAWIVNIEYPCCGHEGRKFETWCEKWTNTIFNGGVVPVHCPHCMHKFESVAENVKIIGLA